MTGSRQRDGAARYPVSEAAARHGLAAPVPTEGAREAYERAGWSRATAAVPMPWPTA